MALASNHEGTYIVGGGFSGDIYLWEVNFDFIIYALPLNSKIVVFLFY